MAATEQSARAGVEAEINYVRNPPSDRAAKLEYVTEAEEHNTMVTLPGHAHVDRRRGAASTTDLDREGFVLVRHESAVADFHQSRKTRTVDQQYMAETAAMLEELTGAAQVFMLGGGKKRYGETAVDKLAPLTNAKPARYPHADNTDASAEELAQTDRHVRRRDRPRSLPRWAMYNVWRAITPPPQDFPLAVCDAQSCHARPTR